MELSPSLKRLQYLLKFWTVLFLGAGIVFLIEGKLMISLLNKVSASWQPFFVPMPNPDVSYWITLTASLMIILVYMSYKAQADLQRNMNLIPVILISKFGSTLFFFIFFITQTRSLANFAGMIVDGSIFLVTYFLYKKAISEMAHG